MESEAHHPGKLGSSSPSLCLNLVAAIMFKRIQEGHALTGLAPAAGYMYLLFALLVAPHAVQKICSTFPASVLSPHPQLPRFHYLKNKDSRSISYPFGSLREHQQAEGNPRMSMFMSGVLSL